MNNPTHPNPFNHGEKTADALAKEKTMIGNSFMTNEALERSRKIELKLQEAERQRDEAKLENVKLTAKLVELQ